MISMKLLVNKSYEIKIKRIWTPCEKKILEIVFKKGVKKYKPRLILACTPWVYCLAEIRVWASKLSRLLISNLYGHFYHPYFDDVWEIKWKIPVSVFNFSRKY